MSGEAATGDTGADDADLRRRCPGGGLAALIMTREAFTFVGPLIDAAHFKAGGDKSPADTTGGGKCGDASPAMRELCNVLEEAGGPHLRVSVRCETIEQP